jgi:hypothetical protein
LSLMMVKSFNGARFTSVCYAMALDVQIFLTC